MVLSVNNSSDCLSFVTLIFPFSRRMMFKRFLNNRKKNKTQKNNFIDGEYEDIEDDDDRKI